MDNELATNHSDFLLRRHISDLLSSYVSQHITIDHVQYLQDITSELMQDVLKPIPTHDPTSLALPIEPMDSLKARYKLGSISPYGELWETQPDVVRYIQTTMGIGLKGKTKTRSERAFDDDDGILGCKSQLGLSIDTILSRMSQRHAPKLGSKKFVAKVSGLGSSLESFLTSKSIKNAKEEAFSHPKIEKIEEFMDIRLAMDERMHASILACHRSTPFSARAPVQTSERGFEVCSEHMPAFLRSDTPPHEEKLQKMSPPLFPREKRIENGKVVYSKSEKEIRKRSGPIESLGDVKVLLQPVEVPMIDPELAEANMVLVSGWTALHSSPSPSPGTPSLASDGSEVDELEDDVWMPSSPSNLPARVKLLQDAKLDEPLFPRSERLQGASSKQRKDESFSSFMLSHVPTNTHVRVANPASDDSVNNRRMRPSSPPISISMVGQPPSDPSSELPATPVQSNEARDLLAGSDDDMEKDVKRLCKAVKNEKAQDLIMREQLDAKESMFMEVPFLSPPNAYLRNETFGKKKRKEMIPGTVKELVNEGASSLAPLKKVVGLKSLNLELSWRPFNYGPSIPTHVELVGVDSPPRLSSEQQTNHQQLDALLAETQLLVDSTDPSLMATSDAAFLRTLPQDQDITDNMKSVVDEQPLILTRSERLAASGQASLTEQTFSGTDLKDSLDTVSEQESTDFIYPPTPDLPTITEIQDQELDASADEDNEVMREWKRRRLLAVEADIAHNDDWEGYNAHMENIAIDPKQLILKDDSGRKPVLGVPPTFVFKSTAAFPPETNNSTWEAGQPVIHTDMPEDDMTPELSGLGADITAEKQDSYVPIKTNVTRRNIKPVNEAPADEPGDAHERRSPAADDSLLLNFLSERVSLSSFLHHRGKGLNLLSNAILSSPLPQEPLYEAQEPVEKPQEDYIDRSAPADLIAEVKALQLPEDWNDPSTQHTYLVSLDLLQKRSLLHFLESSLCAVRVVDREYLTSLGFASAPDQVGTSPEAPVEVSVIPSPHCAIIFFSLAALPSQAQYQTLLASLSAHSFSFSRILLILEAFPRAHLFRTTLAKTVDSRDMPYAYSPPVIKAVKKIRRDLALREGLGEKSTTCKVDLAFADSVEESAVHVRNFGDMALRDSVVDFTSYIGAEEQEGERDLASMQGMNAFSAAVILQCYSIEEFFQMGPEERVAGFAPLIGLGRIELLNLVLNARLEAMSDLPASSDYLSSLSP